MNVSGVNSSTVPLFASATEGVRRAFQKANAAGEKIASGDLAPEPFIDLKEAAFLVKANTAVIRAGDEMLGSLLNVKR